MRSTRYVFVAGSVMLWCVSWKMCSSKIVFSTAIAPSFRRRSPSPPPPAPAPAPQPKPKVKPAVPPPKRRPAPAPAAPPPPPEEEGEIRPPPSGADEYLKILQQAQDDAPQNVNLKPCKVCEFGCRLRKCRSCGLV